MVPPNTTGCGCFGTHSIALWMRQMPFSQTAGLTAHCTQAAVGAFAGGWSTNTGTTGWMVGLFRHRLESDERSSEVVLVRNTDLLIRAVRLVDCCKIRMSGFVVIHICKSFSYFFPRSIMASKSASLVVSMSSLSFVKPVPTVNISESISSIFSSVIRCSLQILVPSSDVGFVTLSRPVIIGSRFDDTVCCVLNDFHFRSKRRTSI